MQICYSRSYLYLSFLKAINISLSLSAYDNLSAPCFREGNLINLSFSSKILNDANLRWFLSLFLLLVYLNHYHLLRLFFFISSPVMWYTVSDLSFFSFKWATCSLRPTRREGERSAETRGSSLIFYLFCTIVVFNYDFLECFWLKCCLGVKWTRKAVSFFLIQCLLI